MLLKSLMMLEGVSRLASPRFSLMEAIMPHRRNILWRRMSPVRRLRQAKRVFFDAQRLIEVFPRRSLRISRTGARRPVRRAPGPSRSGAERQPAGARACSPARYSSAHRCSLSREVAALDWRHLDLGRQRGASWLGAWHSAVAGDQQERAPRSARIISGLRRKSSLRQATALTRPLGKRSNLPHRNLAVKLS